MPLRRSLPGLLLALTAMTALTAWPDDTPEHRFDGDWSAIVSCPNAAGALGYSFELPAVVKDAVFHAEKGEKGEPGWLRIDGQIARDGTANLYANGLVGAAPFAVGQRPAGSSYGYHIDALFTEARGEGHRVEGRPCSVTFTKR